jgi:hypothetical protein
MVVWPSLINRIRIGKEGRGRGRGKEKSEGEREKDKENGKELAKKREYIKLLLKPHTLPPDYASVTGFDPRDFFILCRASDNSALVIRRKDRVHMAVFGEPGMGKSTFLLLQIIQHVRNDEGFCVIDPHGDLAKKVLSIIPKEKWDRVVYIDPTTAEEYRRVVKIALLECTDPSKRGLVAMGFVDSLKKMYEDFWGPRLERILMNAVYAIMEQPEMRLSDLYDIIIDPVKRERILANVRDEMVMRYWTNEFPLLKDDAPTAVTNKICRLIQEKIVAPMFDCSRSSVDFGEAMNEGKFVIINLSEGRLTSDVANFLGALILNKIYQEGMAREDMPESERRPFFIYIDEAHRFVTTSIKDILQALRKYKVYMTLAAQYLGQFDKLGGRDRTLTEAIPQLCDALIVFTVGAETAAALEPYFKPVVRYITRDTLTTLQRYQMAFSIKRGSERYINCGTCVDVSSRRYADPREVIMHSLEIYGQEVDVKKYTTAFDPTPVPDLEPISFFILSYLFYKRDCRLTPLSLIEGEMRKYGFTEHETNNAIRSLLYMKLLEVQTGVSEKEKEKGKSVRYFSMTEQAKAKFRDVPQGQRGGGPEHTAILGRYVSEQRQNGFFCIVDQGADPTRELPDVIVFPPQYTSTGKIHPRVWDYTKKFAVEIETDPYHHRDRVVHNWEKCYRYGLPVNFITTSFENKEMIIGILSGKANPVQNILMDYAPGNIQVDRVTASGEIIRSYEEDAVEGAGGGRKRTEVEELIDQMREMKPAEKFDLLVSRGWSPFIHTTHSNMKEVHMRKGDLTLYVGRYEDLREKYEKYVAEHPAPEPAAASVPASESAPKPAQASTPRAEGASAPISASAGQEPARQTAGNAQVPPPPTEAELLKELRALREELNAIRQAVEDLKAAQRLMAAGARPPPATTTAPAQAPAEAAPAGTEKGAEMKTGAGAEKMEEGEAEAGAEAGANAKTETETATRAETETEEKAGAGAEAASAPTPASVPAPALAPAAASTPTPTPTQAPTSTLTPAQTPTAPQPASTGATPPSKPTAITPVQPLETQTEQSTTTTGTKGEGEDKGEDKGKDDEEEEDKEESEEDYEDEEVICIERTIKEVLLKMSEGGVKEIGAKDLYEAVNRALEERTGGKMKITSRELGLICNRLGVKRKHTEYGNKYYLSEEVIEKLKTETRSG